MGLTESELRTLSLICDAIVPGDAVSLPSNEFFRRSASDLGVDKTLAAIVESKLEPSLRLQFRRLLRIFDSKTLNLALTTRPVQFSRLTPEQRIDYLKGWRDSRIGSKRTGFQALKRLTCFLYYSVTDASGSNPNWSEIGYPGPQIAKPVGQPPDLRIVPTRLDGPTTLECDVCVVGSGAGGSVMAYELSRAGFNVIVVEAGGYETADTFDQKELSMMDRLFDEYGTATTRDLAFILLAGRSAGGGTAVNWMTCIKPPAFVLREWETDYGITGLTSIAFQGYVDEVWNTLKVNLDQSQRNPNNDVLWQGCQNLGYKEGEDFEPIWRNAVGCDQRCAFCTYGCAYSCKQSTLVNYLPMSYRLGTRLLFNSKVERIITQDGKAKGVEGKSTASGKQVDFRISAKAVVVACGAVQTPALLLKSGLKGKHVGTHLRFHPTTGSSGYFDEAVRPWDGPPQTAVVTKFLDWKQGGHGFWIEAIPAHPGFFALVLPWVEGRNHKQLMKDAYNHSCLSIVLVREWGSGTVELDKYGSPVVSYRLDGRDRATMVRGIQETARIHAAAGARRLMTLHSDPSQVSAKHERLTENELDAFFDMVRSRGIGYNRITMGSAHLMGSCRMSSDESLGDVDDNGEFRGVENLFIGDGSVFPTSPGVNPMITIMAMARRTSEHVKKRLKGLQVH